MKYSYLPILYRYYDLNLKYIFDLLQNNRLFLPSPSNFNDPFDCNIPVQINFPDGFLLNEYKKLLQKDCPGWSMEKINFKASNAIDKNYNKLRDIWVNILKDNFNKSGILCFCNSCNNVLLWSHYACKHRGICVEFDYNILNIEFQNIGLIKKAKYFKKTPIIRAFHQNLKEKDNDLGKIIFYKHKRWKYEEEWRFIVSEIEETFPDRRIPFPKEAINKVIIGCKTPDSEKREIINLIDANLGRNKAYIATCNMDSFSIDANKFYSPWY